MNKNIFAWILYDFANSFVFITFLLYFSKWLVVNQGLSDWIYNLTYVLGSIGLIFFAPYFGKKADIKNKSKFYLSISTLGCFLSYSGSILTAILNTTLFWPALFFGIGNFFYQISFVFYNPLLNSISNKDNQGRISGLGFLANYIGQIGGIFLALPFISGKIDLGIDSLIAPLIPATIIFLFCSIPLLMNKTIFAKEKIKKINQKNKINKLYLLPGLSLFLIAFFLYSDALTTIINNFSIFTSRIFNTSDTNISILVLLTLICASIGSLFWGYLSDKYNSIIVLKINLAIYILIIPLVAWTSQYLLYVIGIIGTGLCLGGTWTISRKVLIELVPKENHNHAFGLYSISERAATFTGPIVWSIVVSTSGYRWAMFSMTFFQIISVLLINKIKNN